MRVIPFCLVFLVVSGVCNHLSAQVSPSPQDYKFAVGIRFSSASPTLSNSISIKYFLDETNAIEGLVSYGNRFGLGALYERHQLIGGTPAFTWFYGAGGYVGFEDGKTWLGPTGVAGLDYKFPNAPVNLSLDWKPELDLSPAINFVPDAFGITARFTFK
jgi:hypothetical protein